MKTVLSLLALAFLFAPSPCFALREIGVVTRQEAKEMGIEVRAKGTGPQVWVELEFKAEGMGDFESTGYEVRVKDFVELEKVR